MWWPPWYAPRSSAPTPGPVGGVRTRHDRGSTATRRRPRAARGRRRARRLSAVDGPCPLPQSHRGGRLRAVHRGALRRRHRGPRRRCVGARRGAEGGSATLPGAAPRRGDRRLTSGSRRVIVPDQPQPQEIGALTGAVGPDRRTFVKGLVVGSVFAAPVVSSFTMSGVEAVFGSKAGATVLMSNANTSGPRYPLTGRCGRVTANGMAFTASAGGSRQVTLGVPIGALPLLTQVCVFVGTPITFSGLFPGGDTPQSPFAVNRAGPNPPPPLIL